MNVLEEAYGPLNLQLYIFTACAVIMVTGMWRGYKCTASFMTHRVKHAHRHLVIGGCSWLAMGEFLLLGIGSTRAFLAVLLYLTGILAILTRKYALTFFQELDKMPDYPRTNHELQVLRGIKDQKIFFIILVIYFFAMGTVTLCYE